MTLAGNDRVVAMSSEGKLDTLACMRSGEGCDLVCIEHADLGCMVVVSNASCSFTQLEHRNDFKSQCMKETGRVSLQRVLTACAHGTR